MRSPLDGYWFVLGRRLPAVIGLTLGLTLAVSALGSVAQRSGLPVLEALIAPPSALWSGQLWRLFTWPFVELDGLNLVFGCLLLFWLGGDLVAAWGPRRFLVIYFGLAAGAAALTALVVGLLWPSQGDLPVLGMWAILDALIIAWALLFPGRELFLFFVVPLRGWTLVYATLATTALFALLHGVARFLPHFAAEGLVLLYLQSGAVGRIWQGIRPRGPRSRSRIRELPRRDEPPRWLH
jgi:membrane associated rhomboid family serine protease